MAPKLLAKSQARSSSLSGVEVFRVRSVCSQIGWLETSSAEVAAQAVSNVELLLSAGAFESSVAIDHQLRVFRSQRVRAAGDMGDSRRAGLCTEAPDLGHPPISFS
jgi:hypothetical protein